MARLAHEISKLREANANADKYVRDADARAAAAEQRAKEAEERAEDAESLAAATAYRLSEAEAKLANVGGSIVALQAENDALHKDAQHQRLQRMLLRNIFGTQGSAKAGGDSAGADKPRRAKHFM